MSSKPKTRYQNVPLEIVHATNRARFSLITGGACLILLVILDSVDAGWFPIMVAALTAIIQLGCAPWQFGYVTGYRRGLATWLDEPRGPASDTRSDVS